MRREKSGEPYGMIPVKVYLGLLLFSKKGDNHENFSNSWVCNNFSMYKY
jgi:hypothetical protein